MKNKPKILFTYLTAFKGGGGLEKFNKALMHVLSHEEECQCTFMGLHDNDGDEKYVGNAGFYAGKGKKGSFVRKGVAVARHSDILIVGHINLAIVGVLGKWMKPSLKLVLVTHGIEVWSELTGWKKKLLKRVDRFIAVSHFTANQLIQQHGIATDRVSILHNTFDPFYEFPQTFIKSAELRGRYKIERDDTVVFTLCRLASSERYKGYDRVIKALAKWNHPFKYIIGGKYDEGEKSRLLKLISELNLEDKVYLSGFIKDEEVAAHFQLADLFVMPSTGEGFGIVYIESMANGTPVVAGNADGSVDALDNGKLGVLVNPLDTVAIRKGIEQAIDSDLRGKELSDAVRRQYGFEGYRQKLLAILSSLINDNH